MYPVKTPQDYLHCLNRVSIQKMYIYERYIFLMFEKILNFSHILKIMSIVFSRRFEKKPTIAVNIFFLRRFYHCELAEFSLKIFIS